MDDLSLIGQFLIDGGTSSLNPGNFDDDEDIDQTGSDEEHILQIGQSSSFTSLAPPHPQGAGPAPSVAHAPAPAQAEQRSQLQAQQAQQHQHPQQVQQAEAEAQQAAEAGLAARVASLEEEARALRAALKASEAAAGALRSDLERCREEAAGAVAAAVAAAVAKAAAQREADVARDVERAVRGRALGALQHCCLSCFSWCPPPNPHDLTCQHRCHELFSSRQRLATCSPLGNAR